MILTTPAQRHDLIERIRTIAMVGASANPLRPSYTVFSYLRTQTRYDVAPINPTLTEIDGVRAFPSLEAYARERGAPDLIDVFRKPSELVALVDEAIARADAAGLDVVVDRCVKVEHARFCGRLTTSGLNSGLITSRRPGSSR